MTCGGTKGRQDCGRIMPAYLSRVSAFQRLYDLELLSYAVAQFIRKYATTRARAWRFKPHPTGYSQRLLTHAINILQ